MRTWGVYSQNDRVISGFKAFSLPDGTVESQTFVGIFDPDGVRLSFIDQPGGWATGSLIGSETPVIAWTNPGDNTASMAGTLTLRREKTA